MRKIRFPMLPVVLLAVIGVFGSAKSYAGSFTDEFAGPDLNALWETYLPKAGATTSFLNDAMRMEVPKTQSYNHWSTEDKSPQVRMDAPKGDFTLETHLTLLGGPKGNYHTGLFVMFGKNDLYLFGPYTQTTLVKLERTGVSKTQKTITGSPVDLRIQKVGTRYSFSYKTTGKNWTLLQTDTATEAPVKVGMILKTWSGLNVKSDFSQFHLEGSQFGVDLNQGWISANVLNGDKPVSGPWLLVRNAAGKQVGGIAKAAASGKAAVFNLTPGTYSVKAVSPWMDSDAVKTVTVTAGQEAKVDLQVIPCPDLKLTSGSVDLKTVGVVNGWKLLPGETGTVGVSKLKTYLNPSKADYTPDGVDASLNGTWIQNTIVPHNYGPATIKDNSLFWYRLDMDFPDTWSRFVDREWTLYGYNIDDEDVSYVNGEKVGSIRQGTVDQPWMAVREYPVSPGTIKAPGHNIIAIQGYEGGGGAGMSNSGPHLRVASNTVNNVHINVLDPYDTPADEVHVTVTSAGGAYSVDATTDKQQGVLLKWLPEGDYYVSFNRSSGLDPTAPRKMTVTAGTSQEVAFNIPTLPFLYLDGEHLYNAGLPGWNFMAIPAELAAQAAVDDAPGQKDYVDVYQDQTYREDWYVDVPVPADLGWGDPSKPDKTLPIENNSAFWYRLHATIPQSWKDLAPGRDLILTQFQVDDSDKTFFNGQIIGQTTGDWTKVRTYTIPASLVNWDGDNVIAIKGQQVTGSAGIVGDMPIALAVKPLDSVAPAFVKGDVDGDGLVNLVDAAQALRITVGSFQPDAEGLAAADINGNGTVEVADVIHILKAAIGLETL